MVETARRPTKLQLDLAKRIAALACEREWPIGHHLRESAIAEEFGVSRTPVRVALQLLADRGVVDSRPNQGFFLKKQLEQEATLKLPGARDDEIRDALLRDHASGKLPQNLIETDLLRLYNVRRSALTRILRSIAEEGLIKRRPGHGWSFVPSLGSQEARYESYRFRMMVEAMALIEPGFRLIPEKISQCRADHAAFLSEVERGASPHRFFEINSQFHLVLALCSHNRFVVQAVEAQNALRRLSEYAEYADLDRDTLRRSCQEHLQILDLLERGENQLAAELMRQHLARNIDA
ncbi:GntR family transcriptional regulator [Microvirga sp. ACRRW]|uniref:GntR family transcriptional regulator n=1 Tax=Microvirga sp. ACRRW TaxID=2918205 RepID=UPI001EF48CE1|nr:GntR family transcriptional regulator [Microvirga sp. ACRRW]MCG7393398.1 GntR family transcriptional regulator [Microvirga sp. ACRRW]